MKQFDLKEYTPIMDLPPYTIYEHPKTFHHVMVYVQKRNGMWVKDQVAQWNMPGLATDAPVVVPPGFMGAVVKKLGVGGKKGKTQPQNEDWAAIRVDADPIPAPGLGGQYGGQYYVVQDNLNWANAAPAPRWRHEPPAQAPPPAVPEPAPGPDQPGAFAFALEAVERDIQEIRRLQAARAARIDPAPANDVEF